MKKQKNFLDDLAELKNKLPKHGSYEIISKRLNGKYTAGTIRQMVNGWRTMNPAVLQEIKEYVEFINPIRPNHETYE